MTSASSKHETGQSKLVLQDNPEGKGGEGGGRGVQDGGTHVYGDGKNHPNIISLLQLTQINF